MDHRHNYREIIHRSRLTDKLLLPDGSFGEKDTRGRPVAPLYIPETSLSVLKQESEVDRLGLMLEVLISSITSHKYLN